MHRKAGDDARQAKVARGHKQSAPDETSPHLAGSAGKAKETSG